MTNTLISVKYRCLFVLLPMLFVKQLQAQEKQSYTFSLGELLEKTEQNFPLLQQKKALVGASQAKVTDAKNEFLPSIDAGDQVTFGSDNLALGSWLPITYAPSVGGGARANNIYKGQVGNIASLLAQYDLVTFGKKKATVGKADSEVDLAKLDLGATVYDAQLHVSQLYFTLLKYKKQLNVDAQNVDRYQKVYSVIHALTHSGIKPGADSSLAATELSAAKVNMIKENGIINRLKAQLNFYTNVKPDSITIDTLDYHLAERQKSNEDNSDELSPSQPLLQLFQQKVKLIEADENLIKKSYLPKIILGGTVSGRGSNMTYKDQFLSPMVGMGYQKFNYTVGVGITYNLFNMIHRKDKLNVSRFEMLAANKDLDLQKTSLQSAVYQSNAAIEASRKDLKELDIQIASAKIVYADKLSQYQAGLSNLIDITNAGFVLYRAQSDYVEALNDWYIGQLSKAAANGKLLSFIQTLK